MPVTLKPGARYSSTTCDTEIVVVKGTGDIDLRCGGEPMVAAGEAAAGGSPAAPFDAGTAVGKRYTADDESFEVLCTKPGAGSLSVGDAPLSEKGAKPLPASD